jgi:hypothetical protein
MSKIIQSGVAIIVFALGVSAGNAQLLSATTKKAPAPLLAAGIPAFLALGSGAAIGRAVRRRKTAAREETERGPVS